MGCSERMLLLLPKSHVEMKGSSEAGERWCEEWLVLNGLWFMLQAVTLSTVSCHSWFLFPTLNSETGSLISMAEDKTLTAYQIYSMEAKFNCKEKITLWEWNVLVSFQCKEQKTLHSSRPNICVASSVLKLCHSWHLATTLQCWTSGLISKYPTHIPASRRMEKERNLPGL